MVQAANGAAASPLAQTVASFFGDDGVLLRKFVYRVAPTEGLAKIEPVVKRIASPPRAGIELQIFRYFVLPLLLILVALLGLLVRSFPGPGDLEIIELAVTSRCTWRRTACAALPTAPGRPRGSRWSKTRARPPRRFTLAAARTRTSPASGSTRAGSTHATPRSCRSDLDGVRRALEAATDYGTREERIHALNLDYARPWPRLARGGAAAAHRPPAERARIPALDFVRAKTHLAFAEALRQRLVEPRVQLVTYGKDATRQELVQGASLRIGRYGFVVRELGRGGRKDQRLVLYYDRVPSLLGLKTILPDVFQRAFRFRRSRQRVVS